MISRLKIKSQRLSPVLIVLILLVISVQKAHSMDLFPSPEGGTVFLIANGVITPKDHHKIEAIFKRNTDRGMPTVLLLTSLGGVMESIEGIASVILDYSNQLWAKSHLPNYVVINEECDSACNILMTYLTNKRVPEHLQILVTPDSSFGFHSPVAGFHNPAAIRDATERFDAIKRQIDEYRKAGMDEGWLHAHASIFQQPEVIMIPAKRLCLEHSRVIPPDACLPDNRDVIPIVTTRIKKARGRI